MVCSLCGGELIFGENILSLIGYFDDIIIRMPFHLNCLRESRGDESFRNRIRAIVKMMRKGEVKR